MSILLEADLLSEKEVWFLVSFLYLRIRLFYIFILYFTFHAFLFIRLFFVLLCSFGNSNFRYMEIVHKKFVESHFINWLYLPVLTVSSNFSFERSLFYSFLSFNSFLLESRFQSGRDYKREVWGLLQRFFRWLRNDRKSEGEWMFRFLFGKGDD